jgi:hypothetical protein
MQYPSAYSLGRGVGIDPRIKVHPIRFVLSMLRDHRLAGYITQAELMVPIVFGHHDSCLDECVTEVQRLRSLGKELPAIVREGSEYSLPRSNDPSQNLRDIANTLKNWMLAAALVSEVDDEDRGSVLIEHASATSVISNELSEGGRFIPNADHEESFQRAFGAYDGAKDTSRDNLENSAPASRPDEAVILAEFFKFCGAQLVSEMPEDFVYSLESEYGLSATRIRDVISPFVPRAVDLYESTFLKLATGGADLATEFEKAVTTLLVSRLGLKATHTGQRRRPRGAVGGYADVLIEGSATAIALIDAKATAVYALPADDYRAMASSYAISFRELAPNATKVDSCIFVAGGFRRGVTGRLARMASEIGCGAGAIEAHQLLNLADTVRSADGAANYSALLELANASD